MAAVTEPAVRATDDDVCLLETVHDVLEQAAQGNAEPMDLFRLAYEVDMVLHRWHREQRERRP